MSVLHACFLDDIEKAGRSWLTTVLFLRHDARVLVLTKSSLGEFRVTQGVTDMLKSFVSFSRPAGAAVLEDKLVDLETFISSSEEPDGQWLALGGSPDGVPDIAFVKVDLSGGWEVEVLGPSVAVNGR